MRDIKKIKMLFLTLLYISRPIIIRLLLERTIMSVLPSSYITGSPVGPNVMNYSNSKVMAITLHRLNYNLVQAWPTHKLARASIRLLEKQTIKQYFLFSLSSQHKRSCGPRKCSIRKKSMMPLFRASYIFPKQ